jgi:hypothetical protein
LPDRAPRFTDRRAVPADALVARFDPAEAMTLLGKSGSGLNPACFLAAHGVHEGGLMPACDGRLVRCHLIPKQLLKREGHGALRRDERTWVLGCGGPMGNAGHHGMFDTPRMIRLPRAAIPPALEALAAELGLSWWLDREYGRQSVDEHDEEHYPGERFGHGVCATGRCVEPCGPNGGCMRGAREPRRGR